MSRTRKQIHSAFALCARCALVAALVAWVALPVAAETYHVNLDSGQSYETRYPPEEASWDADTLLFLTETGNWIGVERSRISTVEIETELRGYGERIDATTVFMGRTPNSGSPEQEELSPAERQTRLLETLVNRQQQQPDYSMDQFVEPGDMGQGTSGIPVGFTQQTTPPLGVAGQNPQ